jgi:hypothetical protein
VLTKAPGWVGQFCCWPEYGVKSGYAHPESNAAAAKVMNQREGTNLIFSYRMEISPVFMGSLGPIRHRTAVNWARRRFSAAQFRR